MEKAFIQCQKIFFRFNESWPIWLAPMVIICFLVCLLHLLDRQVELSIRSDFLWQYKLSSEEEGVDTMRGINKILLENILPAHVAEHYLLRGQGMSGILQDNVIIQKKRFEIAFENYDFLCRIATAKDTKTLRSCLLPYQITKNFMMKMMSTSKA